MRKLSNAMLLTLASMMCWLGNGFGQGLNPRAFATTERSVLSGNATAIKWIENPNQLQVFITVTNLLAEADIPLEIWVGGERRRFYGAGYDELGRLIPTNYPPAVFKVTVRRDYVMNLVCTNTRPTGGSLFRLSDFSNPDDFLTLLTNQNPDPVSAFLWSSFTTTGKNILTDPASSLELKQTNLVRELNQILRGPSIYDETRFAGLIASSETTGLLAAVPPVTGHKLIRLNRLLLEDIYRTYGSYYLNSSQDDGSGTADLYFSVQPPPEIRLSKKTPDSLYTIWIDNQERDNLALEPEPEGNVSTNTSILRVVKQAFSRYMLGDGCDDPARSPGNGTWLKLGPGVSGDLADTALEWDVSLGRQFDGLAAGTIALRENSLSRATCTPLALYINTASTNSLSLMDIVTTNYYGAADLVTDHVIRQIRAGQTFVDVLAPDTNQTVLKFYYLSQVATNKDAQGVYTDITGAPFVTWTLSNPEPATTNKLLIVESRNGYSATNFLVRTSGATSAVWDLTQGEGTTLRHETREVALAGSPATTRTELWNLRFQVPRREIATDR